VGESAFLDLNGDMSTPPTTNDAAGPVRVQVRPFVRVLASPSDSNPNALAPPCFPTMEVFDNASGRTAIFSAGFTSPPEPDRQQ
jgi:hypothetical protein